MSTPFKDFVKDNKLHDLFGLLTCDQLKRMRESLNIEAAAADRYLKFKPGTYAKYETGEKLQTPEVDRYIRKVFLAIAPIAKIKNTRRFMG